MSKGIVIALILAAAILLATFATIYFSPYQTCVRARIADFRRQYPSERLPPFYANGAQEYCAVGDH